MGSSLAFRCQRPIVAVPEQVRPVGTHSKHIADQRQLMARIVQRSGAVESIQRVQQSAAQRIVDGATVVRIDQIELPQLTALIDVRHTRGRQLEQRQRQTVQQAVTGHLASEWHEIGEEQVLFSGSEQCIDEIGERRLVIVIRINPAAVLLGLAHPLDQVGNDALTVSICIEVCCAGPGADKGLVQQAPRRGCR